jgi:UDP-glucose 4-epimerase
VVGGSGFLGSHVADQLSKTGHDVRIFDLVKSPWLSKGQEMVIGDLTNATLLRKAVDGAEIVYNFAALADLNDALDKPVETVRTNVLGNVLLLEACRESKVRRFMYASTLYVYSRDGSFYRCSKQAAEHYVEEYKNAFDLDYTILRYGSIYGPRSDARNGLYKIVHRALTTGKVVYEGSPEALREYIHVEDAARASVLALDTEFSGQSVVLTGQEPMRVLDLIKMLAEILGISDAVEFVDGRMAGHYVRTPYAYVPKLGRKFTPQHHVDLGQGLLQLIDEIRATTASDR